MSKARIAPWVFGTSMLALGLLVGREWGRQLASPVNSAEVVAGHQDASAEPRALEELRQEHQLARSTWEQEREEILLENSRLTGELENAMVDRVAREEQFVQFTEMISSIVPPEAPPEIIAALGGKVPEEDPAHESPPSAEELARAARSQELFQKLGTLLTTERVDSLDLLEAGSLGDGWIGPVVFRILDVSGRPIGSLSADRLHLEGSRAGRTLTIVLEDGYERRGGERIPFENSAEGAERGGVRRIFLKQTNPGPWFDILPELFGPNALSPVVDDGRWHSMMVHRRLNQLLGNDVELGYYRLSAMGGVMEDELRDVEIEHLDRSGHLIQRLFADRLSISLEQKGVLLLLRDGIQMKGGHKYDFLGGRYRIFLPDANQLEWKAAGLPGLVSSKESSAGSQAPSRLRND